MPTRSSGSKGGKSSLNLSRSLPSLPSTCLSASHSSIFSSYSNYSSPLEAPQPLCAVTIHDRKVSRDSVSAGSMRSMSSSRMGFTTFERGLEWERSHVVSRLPSKKLPPLHEILRMAKKEFNIRIPKKKDREAQRRKREKDKAEKPSVCYAPYLGGPRLPMRGRVIDSVRIRKTTRTMPVRVEITAPTEERRDPTQGAEEAGGTRKAGSGGSEGKKAAEGRKATEGRKADGRKAAESRKAAEARKAHTPAVPEASAGGGASAGEAEPGSQEGEAGEEVPEKPPAKTEEFVADDLPFPWSDDEMRSAFSRFDQDRDGELHTEELPTLLRYLGARPQPGDVESIVKELTRYSTLSWDEVVQFLVAYRRIDVQRMHAQFVGADEDGSGELDFDELYELLEKLGYYPTAQSTLEAMEALDKDKSCSIAFIEFEGLREHLRVTEGFTKADYAELCSLWSKSCLGKAGPQEVVEEVWRITMYLGYSATIDSIKRLCDQVNPERAHGITANELLKIVRLVRETEIADMIVVMKQYGDDPHRLPCEDLGFALTDLGYHVSEDAVNEILEALGECETEESLTLQEFGAFLRSYRRTEGFTEAELVEMKEVFLQESRLEPGALHTLEVGKVLRWFGFARTVQEVQGIVEEIDLDGSGVLEFTEFVKLMRRLHADEAEHRQQIFYELATTNHSGVLEVHISKFAEAVTMLLDAEPDLALVDAATRSLLSELQGTPRSDADGQSRPGIVFVNKMGFEAWFRHFHRFVVADVRASAGYHLAEKAALQQMFNEYDEDGSGTIERGELLLLLSTYFPDSTKSKEAQQDVQKALNSVDMKDGTLDFMAFLQLTRKCDDSRDSRDMQMEEEVVKECGFAQEEVDGFRQIFSQNVDWKGELDLASLAAILSKVVDLSDDDMRNIADLVCEVHPQGREVARFPQFLKLVKRLTEENYGRLNDQAARFLKRQQEQQEMLNTARRLTQMVAA